MRKKRNVVVNTKRDETENGESLKDETEKRKSRSYQEK